MALIYTDRSRREAWEKCPRKRWWAYEWRGRGIQPVRLGIADFPMLTGTAIHTIIENVLQPFSLERAVLLSMEQYRLAVSEMALDARGAELALEQMALSEALARAWYLVKHDEFIKTFEVLRIEEEETTALSVDVLWMSRADLVVRRRADDALFIVNLKTTKRADERWVAQWPLDQQTLAEVVAVEDKLGLKFSGVIVLGLRKGKQLEYPKGSGRWYYDSPLIWAWHNESGKSHPLGDWSARYEWSDDQGNHRLGKGWVKREVWIHHLDGARGWINHLRENDPAILEKQIIQLPPILRSDFEIERWRISTITSERQIRLGRERPKLDASELDRNFPMHTSAGNCLWPSRCPFFGICHEGQSPDDEQLFIPRRLNHPQEVLCEN